MWGWAPGGVADLSAVLCLSLQCLRGAAGVTALSLRVSNSIVLITIFSFSRNFSLSVLVIRSLSWYLPVLSPLSLPHGVTPYLPLSVLTSRLRFVLLIDLIENELYWQELDRSQYCQIISSHLIKNKYIFQSTRLKISRRLQLKRQRIQ